MDLDLARIYGTPGQKVASAAQEEQFEKQAQAELFAKLAADNGIDLGTLTDEQIGGLWESTFGQKLAEDEKDETPAHEKSESKAEEKKEEDKEKKAAAELAALQEEQQKLAFADQAGRVMAHAMVQELNSINEAIAKEAGVAESIGKTLEGPVGRSLREAARKGGNVASRVMHAPGEALKHHGVAKRLSEHLSHAGAARGDDVARLQKGIEHAKQLRNAALKTTGKAVGGAAAVGAAGGAAAHHKSKESSALDELALISAIEKAAAAGFDTDEAADRLAAVSVLGLGESEKVASAPAGDLDAAVDIRSLEYLEAAGYPVEWTA